MAGSPKTRVYLTVDVECAEERLRSGGLQPPLGYDLRVWGRLRNRQEALGVPLLLRELGRTGLRATFFVEALGARYFGEGDFRELCGRLRDAGQDVQLHLHPIQQTPDWHTRGQAPASDDIGAYDVERQTALLRQGTEELARAGIDRAGLLAFRAGNYGASNDTWRAMRAAGLRLSSSFNLSYQQRNCRLRWRTSANALFRTDVEGIWELPVSNFAEGPGRYRHVQLTAVSFPEVRHYLREARRLGIPEVTLVTHSFEFFFVDSIAERRGRPNATNVERLRRLLAFLAAHGDEFEVETVGALARRLGEGAVAVGREDLVPRGRPALRWGRHLEQARQRLAARARFLT